ncbi:MAG: hypothetical protein JWM09_906 [Francisellaceae bacterium]|nr:hypothetical protein [Francisellaceae bacterium]
MKKSLPSKERLNLIRLHRKERDGCIRDRIKAVLDYDEGYSYSQIARILLLDDETIRRHIQDYWTEKKLTTENGGSESKLDDTQSHELHFAEKKYLYVKGIGRHVLKKYQQKYSVSGMGKWLHSHDFCYKKPHAVPAKANKEAQHAFIEFYQQLKVKAGSKEPIYFTDSVHPEHQTRLAYGWILKGERKAMPRTGRQYRLNFIGGICLNEYKIVSQRVDRIDADSVAAYLAKLRKCHPGKHKIHVILDQAGYHRDQGVQRFAKDLAIELHYLLPYSPNLNPIERLWKIMHKYVTYNHYYESFKCFADAMLHFFKNIAKKKSLLKERITDNFQILSLPIFAS